METDVWGCIDLKTENDYFTDAGVACDTIARTGITFGIFKPEVLMIAQARNYLGFLSTRLVLANVSTSM